MLYHFLKAFYYYSLSKKTASRKTAVEKETGLLPLSSPILYLCHNWTTSSKTRFSHCFLDRCCCQENLSSAVNLCLASFCRSYSPISELRCSYTSPRSALPSVKSTGFLFTGFSGFVLPQHNNKELLKMEVVRRAKVFSPSLPYSSLSLQVWF